MFDDNKVKVELEGLLQGVGFLFVLYHCTTDDEK